MPVFNGAVGAAANDSGVDGVDSSSQEMGAVGGANQYATFRFANVTVPSGATVLSAYIRLYMSGAPVGTPLLKIVGFAEDDTADFSGDDGGGRTETTAKVDWDGITAGSPVTSPNIKTIIQEIINRVGWASGQALGLKVRDDGSGGNNYTTTWQYDLGPAYDAELVITHVTISADIRSLIDSHTTSDNTDHTVNLPPTVEAGDTLICFFACDANETVTFPNEGVDWIQLIQIQNGTAATLAIAWKKAVGDEDGTTMTVTTGSAEQSVSVVWAIKDMADPAVDPPEVSAGATGSSVSPNPDNLAPAGGALNYLWIAVEGHDDDDLATAYPYADNQMTFGSTTGSGTSGLSLCSDRVETDAQDPGNFTIATEEWAACTVAVYPTGEAPPEVTVKGSGVAGLMAMMLNSKMFYG